MLDAYLRKGAVLPTAHTEDRRRVIEDVITSTLFGILRFVDHGTTLDVISILLGIDLRSKTTFVELKLWPQFRLQNGSGQFVEPDIIVDGVGDGGSWRLIIEIKWDDRLTLDQVDRQLAACTAGFKKGQNCFHYSIIKSADAAVFASRETKTIQWYDVLRRLRAAGSGARLTKASVWAADAASFLEKLEIGAFVGIKTDELEPVSMPSFNLRSRRLFEVAPVSDRIMLSLAR